MKKNIVYIAMTCAALSLTACSNDWEDATSKHVYSDSETPYLRTDASANIAVSAEFRKGHVSPISILLKDYAEIFHTQLGMTVDDMIAGIETGKVVFYNINAAQGCWDKTAPTKGTAGWYYDPSGNIATIDQQAGSIELDAARKCLVVNVPEESAAGITYNANVGFAVVNGRDYDQYVRFNVQFSVTDPGLIMPTFTIPAGDYQLFEIAFADYATAIEKCMDMTVAEFNKKVQDPEGDIALYMVDGTGNWIKDKSYTANGIGYWCDGNGNPQAWGEGCVYFVETHDGTVGVGRYPGVTAGTQKNVHFVYASKSDPSRFVEFVCVATFE